MSDSRVNLVQTSCIDFCLTLLFIFAVSHIRHWATIIPKPYLVVHS